MSETLQITVNIQKQKNLPQTHIEEIMCITTIITQQNAFFSNNKFNIQYEVLPMGSPIFSIPPETFIRHTEQIHIISQNNNKLLMKSYIGTGMPNT